MSNQADMILAILTIAERRNITVDDAAALWVRVVKALATAEATLKAAH